MRALSSDRQSCVDRAMFCSLVSNSAEVKNFRQFHKLVQVLVPPVRWVCFFAAPANKDSVTKPTFKTR